MIFLTSTKKTLALQSDSSAASKSRMAFYQRQIVISVMRDSTSELQFQRHKENSASAPEHLSHIFFNNSNHLIVCHWSKICAREMENLSSLLRAHHTPISHNTDTFVITNCRRGLREIYYSYEIRVAFALKRRLNIHQKVSHTATTLGWEYMS